MGKLLPIVIVAVLAVALCEESASNEKLNSMTKDELISALANSRLETNKAKSQIEELQKKLDKALHPAKFNEKAREAHEQKQKAEEKAAEKAQMKAKLQKKEKLSDILMDHGAKFLALKHAERLAEKGSEKQKTGVLAAARKGGRAGALLSLKKVVRATAVSAVKKSRAAAKKNKKNKAEIKKITVEAAKAAVNQMLERQDKLIEKSARKWTKAAIKKFPPSVFLAENDDKPNNFVAPPSIHLSLEGNDDAKDQVAKLENDSVNDATSESKAAAAKAQSIKLQGPQGPVKSSKAQDPVKKSLKPEAAAVAKAAADVKQAAAQVVPESH